MAIHRSTVWLITKTFYIILCQHQTDQWKTAKFLDALRIFVNAPKKRYEAIKLDKSTHKLVASPRKPVYEIHQVERPYEYENASEYGRSIPYIRTAHWHR